jgi:hypothetical protein
MSVCCQPARRPPIFPAFAVAGRAIRTLLAEQQQSMRVVLFGYLGARFPAASDGTRRRADR